MEKRRGKDHINSKQRERRINNSVAKKDPERSGKSVRMHSKTCGSRTLRSVASKGMRVRGQGTFCFSGGKGGKNGAVGPYLGGKRGEKDLEKAHTQKTYLQRKGGRKLKHKHHDWGKGVLGLKSHIREPFSGVDGRSKRKLPEEKSKRRS